MVKSRALSRVLALLLLHSAVALVSAQGSAQSKWQTLDGSPPRVIAHGGFSGLFPSSSSAAYNLALITSVPDVVAWCNVLLTKDEVGICFPNIKLDNSSNIASIFKNSTTVYSVNGLPTRGYFSIDYTLDALTNVSLTQGVFSRASNFDGNFYQILTVEDVARQVKPPALWLNIEHAEFFAQHNLSMRSYVLAVYRRVVVNYISSPEVHFLESISARFINSTTKLVFRFLGKDETEPSTGQTYGSLLGNLTFIRTFASGILVPKTYIWPVDGTLYLQPHTSVVSDAHREGIEVFASEFMNDIPFSYNYSYDPLAEILSFIDNGVFSVDGLLSDFPITPSEAIDCFAHLGRNATKQVNTLVVSKYGASGDYPPCTDLAYRQAILDGADVLDCPVQMSKDGIPFCLSSINLIESTSAAQSSFSNLTTIIPEIQPGEGVFAFNLTWNEIKTLTPSIINPYQRFRLYRNPKYKSSGTLVTLSDFLTLTKNQTSLSNVQIIIENAAYIAEKQGLGVIDAVLSALSKAGLDEPGTPKVMIRSTNSSVLMKFKNTTNYELVYEVDETIRDAQDSAVEDIKKFAHSVVVSKSSVFPESSSFLLGSTNTVERLQSFNLSVYVHTFSNEFVSQAWDFFSDATVEINSYVSGASINGVITDFPRTAARYRKNRCLHLGNDTPPYMSPVEPGSLLQLVTSPYMPPAAAPLPVLTESDVSEPPLPAVSPTAQPGTPGTPSTPTSSPPGNSQPKVAASSILSSMAMFLVPLFALN